MTGTDEARLEAARAEGRDKLRAGVYTRMSLARMDDQTKVTDQDRISRELAARQGITVIGTYTDNNRSAWRHDRRRPGWDAMLADVEAGRINAIIVYHGDRLIRQPMDLEKLIELARGKGIRLLSPSGDRNLDSAEDQFVLGIEANMARRESANISRRQKARYERDRLAGKVMAQGPGGRRLGYRSDGVTLQPPDRCIIATREEESEADVIREMCARTLAGESANGIEADLRARGWTTPAGSPIAHGALRRWLRNPRYAGLMPDGETKAAWPAILKRQDWERARLVLDARAAKHPQGERARWMLTGIARCRCGAPVRIAHVSSRGYKTVVYTCDKRDAGGCGKAWRNAVHLDRYVTAAVVAWLGRGDAPPVEAEESPGADTEWRLLDAERAETEEQLADYRRSAGRSRLLMARLDQIDARMAQLRDVAAGDDRARLLRQYRGVTVEEFGTLPLDVRRALVAASVTVTVLPASRRGPGFNPDDVRVEPAG